MARPQTIQKKRGYINEKGVRRTVYTGGRANLTNTPTPAGISGPVTGVTKSSGITLMPGMKSGNYTLITNPVKTKSGQIIDAADTMTISYSTSMKKAAQELAKTGNPIEKAAANYYLFMDDPTKKGSAKYYENLLKKAGIDINAKSDTGNPVGDFALDVVKGFVGSPAQTARTIAGGGLGAVLLSKEKDKGETLKGGAKNVIDTTVQTAVESPGQLVGGALAGVAGAKGLGILTKKPTIPQTIKTSDFKQTAVKTGSQTLDADFTIKGASYKYKNKIDGKSTIQKSKKTNTAKTADARNTATLDTFLRQDRAKTIGRKIELEGREPTITPGKKQQTSLVTAEEARRPKNNTMRERRRVQQVVEVQRKSGAIFQGMKVRNIPQRIPDRWGLVTAEEARKPKNKSIQERRRVQEVKKAQQKVGAAKPSPATLLDVQSGRRRKTTSTKKSAGTKRNNTRRPRAYETKVKRIGEIKEIPGIYKVEEVPRYAAGANRPITIQEGGNMIFTRDGVITEPKYTLELKPISGWKEAKTKRSIERVRTKSDQKPEKKGGAGAKTKAKAENPRKKKTAKVEFEELDVSQYVQAGRTPSTKKSSGANPQKRRPASKKESETVKEVDTGNGTKAFVRVKTTKATDSKPTSAKVKTQAEKPKGKIKQKTQTKAASKTGKQTRITGEKSTITVKAKPVQQTTQANRIVKPTSEQRISRPNLLTLSTAKTGTSVKQDTPQLPDSVTITTTKPITATTSTGTTKTDGKTKTKKLVIPKAAAKGKTQEIKKTRAAKATPKTKVKKNARLRLKEEEKKKKKRIVKTKKDNALRLETVNQFGWLGLDKKPAAKPRKIK